MHTDREGWALNVIGEQWTGYSWADPPAGVVPRVVSAAYCRQPPRPASGRIVHDFWVLDCARSDCGLVRVGADGAPWRRRLRGTVYLYPPRTPYWEAPSGAAHATEEAWVIFEGGQAAGLRALIGGREAAACVHDPTGRLDAPMYEIARAGQDLGEAGFWRAQAALAAVFDLLRGVVRRDGEPDLLPPADPPAGTPTPLVRDVQDYFRAHLSRPIRLADVASHLSMSVSALSHRYAREAGRPPMAALTELRIEVARGLLLRGLKMDAVARRTGFYDAFHFSKTFRKLCGVPPSRFRREFGRPTP
ncbi:MAG: helix-turn-helix transcriptional regulator [Candidatus Brocadiaceae bacterium]|nr:helix-turn-helix transcriptional regulator [Candidatus Brocadiaceae bacterium]